MIEETTDESGNKPPSLEEFISANHRLFTVIAAFGGLSVYLTQLQDASTDAIRTGVGAVLLLFALSVFIALRKSYQRVGEAKDADEYLLMGGYAVFMYSFVGLFLSVLLIMSNKYPDSSGSILASSILYSGLFFYVSLVFSADFFTEIEGKTRFEIVIRYSPYFGGVLIILWYTAVWWSGTAPPLIQDNPASTIGAVLALLLSHLFLTMILFGILWLIDRGIHRFGAVNEEDTT